MISINFKNGHQESIHLHADKDLKEELLTAVEEYIQEKNEDKEAIQGTPLGNNCPETTILDFITYYFENNDEGIMDTYKLSHKPANENHTLDLKTGFWNKPQRP